jgi:membrane-bound metal-dependent hydrolase YbcI (DUF457 family)
MPVSLIVAVGAAVAGLVVALLLLIKRAHGQPRVLGIIGTVLILLGVLARFAFQWGARSFLGEGDNDPILSILAVDVVAGGVLIGAGLLLVTRAIVVAGWPSWMTTRTSGKQS